MKGKKVEIDEHEEKGGLIMLRDFGGTAKWRACYASDGTGHAVLYAVDGEVVLPAGARLTGEAFSTQEGDRLQVVFSAVVVGGRTQRFEGWALQDGEMGLRGKVLKKGSKSKRGAASLIGAAAPGLAYGTSGVVPGAAGAAFSSLGSSVGADAERVSREWRRSDKVVRVEAGVPLVVYLRRDLTLE